MIWKTHLDIKNTHALFSASQHSWLNYDDDQIRAKRVNANRAMIGTLLHAFCHKQIVTSDRIRSVSEAIGRFKTFVTNLYWDEKEDCLKQEGVKIMTAIKFVPKEMYLSVMMFINDAIGFHMESEKELKYSDVLYGTADAISFNNSELRVHDLKTGLKPIEDPTQLVIYCALFCLDYKVSPEQCKRIIVCVYQNGEIKSCEVSVEQLSKVIERMKHVNEVSEGGLLV